MGISISTSSDDVAQLIAQPVDLELDGHGQFPHKVQQLQDE
jgi:hypothetical protein